MFHKSLYTFLLATFLVTLCYFFVDPAVAAWTHQHAFRDISFLRIVAEIPRAIVLLCGFYYFYFWIFSFTRDDDEPFHYPFLKVANSVAIALFIKDFLKFIFGRYWPETWVGNNLSLIQNNAYGFHFFHLGSAYQSFPSGHTVVVVAFFVALWLNFKLNLVGKILSVMVASGTILALIGCDYHFVGDCLAGGWLGATVATYVTFFRSSATELMT